MIKEIRARLHLDEGVETELKNLAEKHHRDWNDEVAVAIDFYIAKEQAMQVQTRPCIISVEIPHGEDEFRSALEYLRSLFAWVQHENKPQDAFLCAAPKNGLSYDEAFILCEKHFGSMHGIGWVYADTTDFQGKEPRQS